MAEVEWLLAEFEADRIEPVPVALVLPPGLSPVAARVARFYALVLGLRLWAGDDRPVLFGTYWIAEKLRIPQKTAWRARSQLVEAGVLVSAGRMAPRDALRRGTDTFLPGGSASAQVAQEAVAAHALLPSGAGAVEADDAGRVDQGEEVREDAAVLSAEPDDGRKVPEGDGGLATAGDGAGGLVGHGGSSGGNVPAGRYGGRWMP